LREGKAERDREYKWWQVEVNKARLELAEMRARIMRMGGAEDIQEVGTRIRT
jgi:hypothetical protein